MLRKNAQIKGGLHLLPKLISAGLVLLLALGALPALAMAASTGQDNNATDLEASATDLDVDSTDLKASTSDLDVGSIDLKASTTDDNSVLDTEPGLFGVIEENLEEAVYDTLADNVCFIGTVGYADLTDAIAAVQDGQTIRLYTNIKYYQSITISGKSVFLDVNGYALEIQNSQGSSAGGALIVNNGELWLFDSSESGAGYLDAIGTANAHYGVYVTNGKVTVTNAQSYSSSYAAIYASGASQVIVEGSITADANRYINLAGSNRSKNSGIPSARYPGYLEYQISLTGSTFVFVKDPSFIPPASGYACSIGTTQYRSLYDALAVVKDGDIIKLLASIDYNHSITVTGMAFTFDVNGYTLNVQNLLGGSTAGALYVNNGEVKLTDSSPAGNGELNANGSANARNGVYASNGKATVTNASSYSSSYAGVYASGASQVIVEAEIKAGNDRYVTLGGYYRSKDSGIPSARKPGYLEYQYSPTGNTFIFVKDLNFVPPASGYAVSIGDTYYVALYDALLAAKDGDIIKLLADIDYNHSISVNGMTLAFDVNGYTLNIQNLLGGSTSGALHVNNGELQLIDSSLSGGGELNAYGNINARYAVYTTNGKTTVTNASSYSSSYAGIYTSGSCQVTVEGGITADPERYVNLSGSNRSKDEGIPSARKPGYLEYQYSQSASNFIFVKDLAFTPPASGFACSIGEVEYQALFDALAAVKDGDTIKLLADNDYNHSITVSGMAFTIDVNGYTLNVQNLLGGSLTAALYVNNGELRLTDSSSAGGGELNVLGTSYARYGVYAANGKATVTNASSTVGSSAVIYASGSSQVIVEGEITADPDRYISLSGSNRSQDSGVPSARKPGYLEYQYSQTGSTFVFVKDPSFIPPASGFAASIGDTKYISLYDALTAVKESDTIKLLADIDYTQSITVSGMTITFDVNGYTLNVSNLLGSSTTGTLVVNSGEVKLIDSSPAGSGEFNVVGTERSHNGVHANNGKATVTNASEYTSGYAAVYATGTSQVTVEGEIIGDPTRYVLLNSSYRNKDSGIYTVAKPGYLEYRNGNAVVWVRDLTDPGLELNLAKLAKITLINAVAEGLVAADYTPESWSALEAAIATAIAQVNAATSISEVDAVVVPVAEDILVPADDPGPETGAPGSGDLFNRGYVSMDVALLVAQIVAGYGIELTPNQFAAVDMDGDGLLTMADVLLIMRKAV
ncbi:MAG: hypothetical protein LBU61_04745 [Coriobacteriales bacterium]|jgi:hypothetical protein|nr:hypothetical protein [Coriobacteriales bacterium]